MKKPSSAQKLSLNSFRPKKRLILILASITVSSPAADYSYDALNRLTQVSYEKGQVLNYNYDAAGNLLSVTEGHSTQAQCLLYAVHDQRISDTQFLTVDPANDNAVELLGPLYAGYNIESLDVHPLTNELYAASKTGQLYQLNGFSGELQLLGTTGYSKINGLSFDPVGQLWGWVNNTGLIQIALPNLQTTLEYASAQQVSEISWNNEGRLLYTIVKTSKDLMVYDLQTQQMTVSSCSLPRTGIESLEMEPGGQLLFSRSIRVYSLDLTTCEVNPTDMLTIYDGWYLNDIEALAWPIDICTQ